MGGCNCRSVAQIILETLFNIYMSEWFYFSPALCEQYVILSASISTFKIKMCLVLNTSRTLTVMLFLKTNNPKT